MFGFIYLWYDRKTKMYCLGSHYGSPDDGYVTSTGWMKKAYAKRPEDFKRRLIWSLSEPNLTTLQEKEQYYLDMIKETELSLSDNVMAGTNRYYNMKKQAKGGNGRGKRGKQKNPNPWNKGLRGDPKCQAWNKGTKNDPRCMAIGKKVSLKLTGRQRSSETKFRISSATRLRWQRKREAEASLSQFILLQGEPPPE